MSIAQHVAYVQVFDANGVFAKVRIAAVLAGRVLDHQLVHRAPIGAVS